MLVKCFTQGKPSAERVISIIIIFYFPHLSEEFLPKLTRVLYFMDSKNSHEARNILTCKWETSTVRLLISNIRTVGI